MSFVRPEVAAGLKRWREALIAAAVLALGLFWALTTFGIMRWVGVVVTLVGAGLAYAAVQRARFHWGGGGAGVVEVTERQITYLAPVGGGFASLDALTAIEIAPDRAGEPTWCFTSPGEYLAIPASAEGIEKIFDVLTALPGIDMEAAIRAGRGTPDRPVVIWHAPARRLH